MGDELVLQQVQAAVQLRHSGPTLEGGRFAPQQVHGSGQHRCRGGHHRSGQMSGQTLIVLSCLMGMEGSGPMGLWGACSSRRRWLTPCCRRGSDLQFFRSLEVAFYGDIGVDLLLHLHLPHLAHHSLLPLNPPFTSHYDIFGGELNISS